MSNDNFVLLMVGLVAIIVLIIVILIIANVSIIL